MAAWLAFLKSRLLLPPEPGDEGPSAEDLAAHLAFQLERLAGDARGRGAADGARPAGARLLCPRPARRRDPCTARSRYTATLLDLMRAYARIRTKDEFRPFVMDRDHVFTMEQALDRMRGLIGYAGDWADLTSFLPEGWDGTPMARRSATAAHFAAVLELAKRGQIDLRQGETFAPDPDPPEGRADDARPDEKSLFDAPPMGEQERMVEAILFAIGRTGDGGRTGRAPAAWLRPGRGAGASAQTL